MTATSYTPAQGGAGGPADLADVRDMAIVHQFFRREITLAPLILRDLRPEEHERRAALGSWLGQIADGIHHHHEGEDAHVFPLLAARVAQPELIRRMDEQHVAVAEGTDAVEARLRDWLDDAGPAPTSALIAAYERLLPVIGQHLGDEEREVVPLIAEHLTGEEYGRGAKSGNGKYTPQTLMMSFGGMVEECSAEDARWMIGHLDPAVQQAWYSHGRDDYRALMALLRGRTGSVPAPRG